MIAPRRLAATLLPWIVVVGGCSGPPAALRADVERYLHQMYEWAPVEAETARTIDRILATQFVDETEVRRQVAADLPRVMRHLEHVRTYTAATPSIRSLHERYLAAWETLGRGYNAIVHGLDSGDATGLAAGRRAFATWRRALVDVARDLRELADQSGARVSPTPAASPRARTSGGPSRAALARPGPSLT